MHDELQLDEVPADANEPATKGDVAAVRRDVTVLKQEIFDYFDAAVENIKDEMAGANTDEISTLRDADNTLHERLVPLEQRQGIQSPTLPHPLP